MRRRDTVRGDKSLPEHAGRRRRRSLGDLRDSFDRLLALTIAFDYVMLRATSAALIPSSARP